MNPIDKAIRNKDILAWYNAKEYGAKVFIMSNYAAQLGCPLTEIVAEMDGPDDLDYLWTHYQKEITDFSL